jgi:hypothetical protein
METVIAGREAVKDEELLVHNWRVTRLTRLGIPGSLAEVYADRIDCTRLPAWYSAAARHGWPCASPADDVRPDADGRGRTLVPTPRSEWRLACRCPIGLSDREMPWLRTSSW